MKKIYLFALSAIVLASCAKEGVAPVTPDHSNDVIVKTVSLEASFEQDETKASLGAVNDGKVAFLWNTGDAVKSYVGTKALSTVSEVAQEDNYSNKAVFNISFLESEVPSDEANMILFYPAGKGDHTISSEGVSFTFPAEQWAALNGISADKNYNKLSAAIANLGSATDVYNGSVGKVQFKNAFAIVKFAFDETLADVKKISISGRNGEVLCGTYNIAADASVKLDANKTKYNQATLVYDSGASFSTAGSYYLVIAPTTFEKGFTVRLTLADGTVLYRNSPDKKYEYVRSSVNDLKTLNRSMFKSEPAFKAVKTIENANPRNIAMDKDYLYIVGANATNLKAYDLATYEETSMDVSSMLNSKISQTFKTCAVRTIDNNGSSIVLVSNLASAGNTLCVYKYESLTSVPAVALSYTVPSNVRLGDKFTVDGDWNNGRLIFHDYSGKTSAYSFEIKNGVISQNPTKITYDATFGNTGAMYKYSDSEWMWAGVSKDVTMFDGNFVKGDKLTLKYNPSNATAVHGISFFELNGIDIMTYLQVVSGTSSVFHAYALPEGATLAKRVPNAKELIIKQIETVGNSGACGDVAVYSNGTKAYVAALATGYGVVLYEVE